MKVLNRRSAVAAAEMRLLATRRRYRVDTRWLQEGMRNHRGIIIVSAGAITGAAMAWLPLRAWLRTGLSMISLGAMVARTPLGPIALGALLARRTRASEDQQSQADREFHD